MNDVLPQEPPITFRRATRDDFPAIAALLVQLYAVELPGALVEPRSRYAPLLQWTLEAKDEQGLRDRFVVCGADGTVVASAALERPAGVRYDRAPNGTIKRALALLGYGATAKLLKVVAQSMIGVQRPTMPDAVGLHSVIVDQAQRGRGIGIVLMREMEREAASLGYAAMWLQVLASNQPARALYQRVGYEVVWLSPQWAGAISWPTHIMRKSLCPSAETP